MPEIVVDGVRYAPADQAYGPRIGVGITTRNRPDTTATTLKRVRHHTPGALVVVVDDASEQPVPEADYRFEQQAGIPRAKNKAIELLMAAGVEHLFLFDDDAYPLVPDWWKPYVESPEPHLMYQFLDLAGARKLGDIKVLHDDGRHVAYTGPRGVMLYFHRTAIETCGGMDAAYGLGMYEHGDLSNRIHHAGLTTWRYADVAGSSALIHSMDEHEQIERSVTPNDRATLVSRNVELHNTRMRSGYTAFCEYRDQTDAVITTLLTSQIDPQRGTKWDPDPAVVNAWAQSLTGHRAVILADELDTAPHGATIARVPDVPMNVYHRRWVHIYQHLRDHPEYRFAWCTDGSDVVLQNDPFPHMEAGRLYVGSEPKTLADEWMRTRHPASRYQELLDTHPHRTMLNAGLLGGDRDTVMRFAHLMGREYYDLEAERFWGNEPPGQEVGDMAAFNLVAYTHFTDQLVTGPAVHTIFKAEQPNGFSWWKHR